MNVSKEVRTQVQSMIIHTQGRPLNKIHEQASKRVRAQVWQVTYEDFVTSAVEDQVREQVRR